MRMTCAREGLLSAFQLVQSAMPSRDVKPILKNVKAIAEGDRCTLMATDLEVGIRYDVLGGLNIEEAGEAILPAAKFLAILRESTDEELTVEADASAAALGGRSFDSIVLINVLEHIERDVEALRSLAGLLTPQGRCIAFAPALPRLYSDVDRAIGHFRRYLRQASFSTRTENPSARAASRISWLLSRPRVWSTSLMAVSRTWISIPSRRCSTSTTLPP